MSVRYGHRLCTYDTGKRTDKKFYTWQLLRERGGYIKVVAESIGYYTLNGARSSFNTYKKVFNITSEKRFDSVVMATNYKGFESTI